LKQDIANILDAAKRKGAIPVNPASEAEIPKFSKGTTTHRETLTDEELVKYLAWEHPHKSHKMAVLERQTMSCIARMFGGLRTGDLDALRWESLETAGGAFTRGWAPRQKTGTPQALEIPGMLRPIIRDWWETPR